MEIKVASFQRPPGALSFWCVNLNILIGRARNRFI